MARGKVVYLDFGTKRLHLARPGRPMMARCGVGAVLPMPPPHFEDRPGLFASEMCRRCLKLTREWGESDG